MLPPGPTVASLQESDILASLSAFARAFNTDRETLRRCLVSHDVEHAGERGGHKLYALRHVYQAWCDDTQETDPDKLSPFKRRAWYQGETEKLSLQQRMGELVNATEMERVIGQLNQLYVRGLETLQDVLERDCGLRPEQAMTLERHVDTLRIDLHAAVANLAGEPAADPPADDESQPARTPSMAKPRKKAKPRAKAKTKKKPTPKTGPGSAVEEAVELLRRELRSGPRPTSKLIAKAKAAGLSETSLRRAKASLGDELVAKRQGKGWVWLLAGVAELD